MNSTYISAGTRLNYRDSGCGTPVVFLHPTPLDGDYWRPVIEALPGIRALVPDLRGHGQSELGALPLGAFAAAPDAPVLTMTQLAADTLALLDHLQLPSAVFAGCSIGGYVLLDLWRRAPDRMRGLAFVCSKPQPDAEANLARRAANIAQARAEGLDELFDAMAQTLVGSTARQRRPDLAPQLRAHMTLTVEAFIAVQAGLALRADSTATVATIAAPLLAVAGGQDPAATPAEMEAFRAAPASCRFHLLPDAGHFAAYEQPAKVAELLAGWLKQIEE